MRELTRWLSDGGDPGTFPYPPVVAAFHRAGKHFVSTDLLSLLDRIRAFVATGPDRASGPLRDFLDVALDKWDGRYDYQTYTALRLLGLGGTEHAQDRVTDPRAHHDLLCVHLIADALAFELAAEAGTTSLLPLQRPEPARLAKRYRLGVRAAKAVLARLGLSGVVDHPEPAVAAAALHAWSLAHLGDDQRRALSLSMLPVYVMHDEYLFIRVLQTYESTFALLVSELRATVDELTRACARPAADRLAHARGVLDSAGPLFSLMATMQPDSFRAFRVYTEGASAIQSRSYKLVESLCRPPDARRLASAAYWSVPEVRDRVIAGQPTVEQAFRAAVRADLLAGPDRQLLVRRMGEFAQALAQWRTTHYRIAVRMLGTRPGTGYTEGTPYLAAVRTMPTFTTTPTSPTSDARWFDGPVD